MNNFDEIQKNEITPNLPLWSFQFQPNSKLALKTRKDLEMHLITHALKNEYFKRELLANPKAVIEQELGSELPEKLEINILEETENTIYMVLPCNPYKGLSEEDLQNSLGMTYENVAQWVLEQQRNSLLHEASSIKLIAYAWRDKLFKQKLFSNPLPLIEQELGEKVQNDIEIKFFEESNENLYFVIPKILDNFEEQNTGIDEDWIDLNIPNNCAELLLVINSSSDLNVHC